MVTHTLLSLGAKEIHCQDCSTEALEAGAVRGMSTGPHPRPPLFLCPPVPLSQGTASPSLLQREGSTHLFHLLLSKEGVGVGRAANISQRGVSHTVIKTIP